MSQSMIIVVMGVCGTGKSTLGKAIADALHLPFIDADDLHPQSNIAKMSAGHPLNDHDRWPWLRIIRATSERLIREQTDKGIQGQIGVVVGCSALRRVYRDILRGEQPDEAIPTTHEHPESVVHPNERDIVPTGPTETFFVYIDGPYSVMLERMENRQGHFMKTAMLDSQLATLENPAQTGEDRVTVVALADSTEDQVKMALDGLKEWGVQVD